MTAWLAPRARELHPRGMSFLIERRRDGQWQVSGTDLAVPFVCPSKQPAIFRAEFLGMDCDRVTIQVSDPDEERFDAPDYWSGDLIDCP